MLLHTSTKREVQKVKSNYKRSWEIILMAPPHLHSQWRLRTNCIGKRNRTLLPQQPPAAQVHISKLFPVGQGSRILRGTREIMRTKKQRLAKLYSGQSCTSRIITTGSWHQLWQALEQQRRRDRVQAEGTQLISVCTDGSYNKAEQSQQLPARAGWGLLRSTRLTTCLMSIYNSLMLDPVNYHCHGAMYSILSIGSS